MKIIHIQGVSARIVSVFLAAALLPAFGQSAGYKFTSFQYPGATSTLLTGVDDSNRMTGWSIVSGNTQGFFVSSAETLGAVMTSGFQYTVPQAISQGGGIVGTAFDGVNYLMFRDNADGFGTIPVSLANQTVSGINSSFNIVGNFTGTSENSAYAQIRGVYHVLLPSRCASTHDPAINDKDEVVGSCVDHATGANIGFTWSKGKYTYFEAPAGIPYLQPTGISKNGIIVGFYDDTSGYAHGFVLKGGTFTTVDYPATGAYNTQILGVNSAGKLVGVYNGSGETGFFATPK